MKLLKRPLALACVAFVLCSVIGFLYPMASAPSAVAFAVVSAVLLILYFVFKKGCGQVLFACFFCALFSCAAFFSSYMHFGKSLSLISGYYSREVVITGCITEVEHTTVYSGLYGIRTLKVDGDELEIKLRLESNSPTFSRGDVISFCGVIRPFEDDVNGYAEKLISMADGYIAACEQTGEEYKKYYSNDSSFVSVFESMREWSVKRFASILKPQAASLYSAVFAGDRSEITDGDMLSVRRCGVSHLLAVSGMHFSVIMALVLSFLSALGIPIKPRYALLSAVALIYMAFTGFSPSVVRSGIMLFVTYLGAFVGKNKDMFTSLMLTVTVMIAASPYLILNASFLLSSSATLGIILLSPAIDELFAHGHKRMLSDILRDAELSLPRRILKYMRAVLTEYVRSIPVSLASAVAVSVFAVAFSLPFSLLFFKSISLASVPAGIILSPLVSLILTTAPFILIFGGISAVGYVFSFAGDAFFLVTHFFSDIDGVYMNIGYPVTEVLIAVFFALISVCVLFMKKRKLIIPLVACFLAAVVTGSLISENFEFSGVDMTYKSTTESDALCVRADNGIVIADMGSDSRSDVKAALSSASALKHNEISAYVFTTFKAKSVTVASYLFSNCKLGTVYFPRYASRQSAVAVEAAAKEAESAGVSVGYFYFGEDFYVDGCRLNVSELEYLSRSAKPMFSVRIDRRDESVLWCSRSYFDGEKSGQVYKDSYDVIVFGSYGPKVKDGCKAVTDRLFAELFIVSEEEIYSSFDKTQRERIFALGAELVGEQTYRYSSRIK